MSRKAKLEAKQRGRFSEEGDWLSWAGYTRVRRDVEELRPDPRPRKRPKWRERPRDYDDRRFDAS